MVTQRPRANIRTRPQRGQSAGIRLRGVARIKGGLALPPNTSIPLRLHDGRTSNWTVPAHLCSRQNVIAGFLGD